MAQRIMTGAVHQPEARIYRMTITLVALHAEPGDDDFDPTLLIDISEGEAQVIGWDTEELLLIEPACDDCQPNDDLSISKRDAVLFALDDLVIHELGDAWSAEAHCKRKMEMLEIIDGDL